MTNREAQTPHIPCLYRPQEAQDGLGAAGCVGLQRIQKRRQILYDVRLLDDHRWWKKLAQQPDTRLRACENAMIIPPESLSISVPEAREKVN